MSPRHKFSALLALSILLAAFVSALRATELSDLGQGLRYLRVADLGEVAKAVSSNVAADSALVLDLRRASAGNDAAAILRSALSERKGSAPLLILVGPSTPEILVPALDPLPRGAATLGIAGSRPAPLVVVNQSAGAHSAALDSHDAGKPLVELIAGKLDKERFDEASLAREFANGNRNPQPPPAPDPTQPDTATPEASAIPVDRVLQRAVHLHRTLLAIKAR